MLSALFSASKRSYKSISLATPKFFTSGIKSFLHRRTRRQKSKGNDWFILNALLRASPDPMSAKDMDGRFVAANQATAKLMRTKSEADLIGKTDFDFYPHDVALRFRQDELDILGKGEPERLEQPVRFEDGSEGWLETLKIPYKNKSNQVVGIFTHNRNITDLKRYEQLKAEFIKAINHELRTPVTAIRGSLGLLASGVPNNFSPEAEKLIKIACKNSDHLVLLLEDISDVAMFEAGRTGLEIVSASLLPIVEKVISSVRELALKKNAEISFVDNAPSAQVKIDPKAFGRVLEKLLTNAVNFSPKNGRVVLAIERLVDESVRVSVSDEGKGIPENFRNRIFGRFERADGSDARTVGGMGLGLNVAKALIEAQGGTIGFTTESGRGTVFFLDVAAVGSGSMRELGAMQALW